MKNPEGKLDYVSLSSEAVREDIADYFDSRLRRQTMEAARQEWIESCTKSKFDHVVPCSIWLLIDLQPQWIVASYEFNEEGALA